MMPRPRYRGSKPRFKPLKVKANADPRLKKVFSQIGVPPDSPFRPDRFQTEAVAAVVENDCLVTAPTGSGKTWIAVQSMRRVFDAGGRCWYASPLKALSNSKYNEFADIFGPDNVGILTGDRKENPDTAIIVGTTEILRNQLYDAMGRGVSMQTDFVVLDEAHFLGDPDRGVVWEEVLIYLPTRVPLLLLSATIGNARQIARWLKQIRGRACVVIEAEKRPVPLFPMLMQETGTLLPLVQKGKASSKLDKQVRAEVAPKRRGSRRPPLPWDQVLRVLQKYDLLPAIFFLKSRADCDRAVEACADHQIKDASRQARIERQLNALVGLSAHTREHRQLTYLRENAVGSHHAGQLPAWKLILETMMSSGLLDAVFATSTVAAGVNFPARSIVVFNTDHFNGEEFVPFTASQWQQMIGRAGRRGKDNIGFAVMIPGRFMDASLAARLMNDPPTEVHSQININFSMALNLLISHTPDQVRGLLAKSFAAWMLNRRKSKTLPLDASQWLVRDFQRHLDFLTENDFVNKTGALTTDGHWASKLRVDQPLLIAQALRLNLMPAGNPALLAGITAAFVYERDTDPYECLSSVPQSVHQFFKDAKRGLMPFILLMARYGFGVRSFFFTPVLALWMWASDTSWERVQECAGIGGGDLVMLILRTADHLRHIAGLKSDFPEVAEAATQALGLILRDPVLPDLVAPDDILEDDGDAEAD